MSIHLTKTEIDSFTGDVVSLRLLNGDAPQSAVWSVSGDAIKLRVFETVPSAVLVQLLCEGTATVTADDGTQKYTCTVKVHTMHHAAADEPMQYYFGDLHVHTTMNHNIQTFPARTEGFPQDMVRDFSAEGKLNFHAISDHACLLNENEFLRGFIAAEETEHDNLISLPGAESEITFLENDRYGIRHKNSGEIVTLNASGYINSQYYEDLYDTLDQSVAPIAILAHPQVMGSFIPGIWNFQPDRNIRLKKYVKLIEMGNGTARTETPLFEHTLSVALDAGYHVSTSCDSDHHGPTWSAGECPGKTVIMATEKTKEAFIDAILSNRCYASESGKLCLRYSVNGAVAPATVEAADSYTFHIDAFYADGSAMEPMQLDVLSDGEKRVARLDKVDVSSLTFTVTDKDAHYFYLRFTDALGQKTWSTPVWTTLAPVAETDESLRLADKSTFLVRDAIADADASMLLNNTPNDAYRGKRTVQLTVDTREEKTFGAISIFAPMFEKREQLPPPDKQPEVLAHFPCRIALYYSTDGQTYQKLREGCVRVFGGENRFDFEAVTARYWRIDILTSVGQESGWPQYTDTPIDVGELEFYEKK